MKHDELMDIVRRHAMWLRDEDGGKRADLIGADLIGADLRYANLIGADLSYANLSHADLRCANLSHTNLIGANLSHADLSYAVGSNSRIQSLQIFPYRIIILDRETVWGGCTKKTAKEWLDYDGADLSESDKKYLETVTKPFIRIAMEV